MDDHSTDGSWALLGAYRKNFPKKISIHQNQGKGGNFARNYGFTFSKGKYIQWLDSDDRLLPGKLKAQVEFLEDNPEIDIAYSDWQMDFYEEGVLRRSEPKEYGPFSDFLLELIRDNWTVPCNYLVKKSIADQLSGGVGWSPQTQIGQDREYFTKAAIFGAKFGYVKGSFSVYNRWSNQTVSVKPFDYRLSESYQLECMLKELIKNQDFIAKDKKIKYLKILNAQALLANYYASNLKIKRDFSLWKVDWGFIHWKLRPIILIKELFMLVFK